MARSAPPTKKPSRPFVVQILDAAPFTRSKTLLSSSSAVTEMNDTTAVGSLYPCFLHQPGLEYSGLWETGETMQASKWPISQHTALYSKLIHNFFFGIQKWNQKWLLLDLRIKRLRKKVWPSFNSCHVESYSSPLENLIPTGPVLGILHLRHDHCGNVVHRHREGASEEAS